VQGHWGSRQWGGTVTAGGAWMGLGESRRLCVWGKGWLLATEMRWGQWFGE